MKEGRGFRDLTAEFKRADAHILGISFDSEKANAAFARKYHFEFPLLCDTDHSIGLAYGACESLDAGFARRISYLIDPQGKIVRAYEKVDTARHAKQVLEDVLALASSH